jgi:hypothetical protein
MGKIENTETPGRRKGGRPPRPARCVIQLREKDSSKGRLPSFSLTIDLPFGVAMKLLQDTFQDRSRRFSRATDPIDL